MTTSNDSQSIHVWDLRAIRQRLAEIGLGWDVLGYPPPAQPTESKPLKVTVDLGDLANSVPKE